jgi:hypothetical protein
MSATATNGKTQAPASLLSGNRFPGRSSLRIFEIAVTFEVTDQHVINWTDGGQIGFIDVSHAPGESVRKFRRIPICEYDAFVIRRFSLNAINEADSKNGKNGHSRNGHAKTGRRK